jgi:hypothetical protein
MMSWITESLHDIGELFNCRKAFLDSFNTSSAFRIEPSSHIALYSWLLLQYVNSGFAS